MNIKVKYVPEVTKLEFSRCVVCNTLTSYWWLYCKKCMNQIDAEMESE